MLGHKNNIFYFPFFDVNACVKVGSWNVFKLSLDADAGFASAPWFHFMGCGHVDKSNTRIADKCVTLFFIFIFFKQRRAPVCRPQVCACPPSCGMCALPLCMAAYLRASQFLPLSQPLPVHPGQCTAAPPDTLAQV